MVLMKIQAIFFATDHDRGDAVWPNHCAFVKQAIELKLFNNNNAFRRKYRKYKMFTLLGK